MFLRGGSRVRKRERKGSGQIVAGGCLREFGLCVETDGDFSVMRVCRTKGIGINAEVWSAA